MPEDIKDRRIEKLFNLLSEEYDGDSAKLVDELYDVLLEDEPNMGTGDIEDQIDSLESVIIKLRKKQVVLARMFNDFSSFYRMLDYKAKQLRSQKPYPDSGSEDDVIEA